MLFAAQLLLAFFALDPTVARSDECGKPCGSGMARGFRRTRWTRHPDCFSHAGHVSKARLQFFFRVHILGRESVMVMTASKGRGSAGNVHGEGIAASAAGGVFQNMPVEKRAQAGAQFSANGGTQNAAQSGSGDSREDGTGRPGGCADLHADAGCAEDAGHAACGACNCANGTADAPREIPRPAVNVMAVWTDAAQVAVGAAL